MKKKGRGTKRQRERGHGPVRRKRQGKKTRRRGKRKKRGSEDEGKGLWAGSLTIKKFLCAIHREPPTKSQFSTNPMP